MSKLILFGERFLRLAVKESVTHHQHERNHQGKKPYCCSPQMSIRVVLEGSFNLGGGSAEQECSTSIPGPDLQGARLPWPNRTVNGVYLPST